MLAYYLTLCVALLVVGDVVGNVDPHQVGQVGLLLSRVQHCVHWPKQHSYEFLKKKKSKFYFCL